MVNDTLFAEIGNQLSAKYSKPVKIIRSFQIGGGCIHNATFIETNEGRFFLKWNISGPADIFVREAEALQELSGVQSGNLIIPDVILHSEISNLPGFLLLEYLDTGVGGEKDEIALGRGLAEIHQYQDNFFGFSHNNYCGLTPQKNNKEDNWIKFYGENRLLFIMELICARRDFSLTDARLIEKLVAKLPSIFPSNSVPALIHGDLWSGNYMITTRGPALIDPAVCYADREMEFGILTLFGGFSRYFWQGYNELYPLPVGWKERNPVYQLYHLLNHYYLFGGSYGSQALSIARYFAG